MERTVYSFNSTIELEKYVDSLRIQHARNYLSDKIDLRLVEKEDFIAIYSLLQIKDKEKKKKILDEIQKK